MHDQPLISDQATGLRRLNAQRSRPPADSGPCVVTITSGKGGVGKSTLALNLGIKLSDMGQKVLLLDGDSNLGNLDIMSGLSPKYRLSHVLNDELAIEDALVDAVPGLKILPGSSGDARYPLFEIERQNRFLEDLVMTEEKFDYVMIDTAAGLNKEIVNFAVHSDEVIVVSNVEPTSVMDAYAMMKVVSAARPGSNLGFILNSVRHPKLADEAAGKLKLALNHFLRTDARYIGFVPFDECVPRSVASQQPVSRLFPWSAASLSIQSLARSFALQSSSRRKARRSSSV